MTTPMPFPILDLPLEVRLLIYAAYFASVRPTLSRNCIPYTLPSGQSRWQNYIYPDPQTSLLQTSRAVRAEALPVLEQETRHALIPPCNRDAPRGTAPQNQSHRAAKHHGDTSVLARGSRHFPALEALVLAGPCARCAPRLVGDALLLLPRLRRVEWRLREPEHRFSAVEPLPGDPSGAEVHPALAMLMREVVGGPGGLGRWPDGFRLVFKIYIEGVGGLVQHVLIDPKESKVLERRKEECPPEWLID